MIVFVAFFALRLFSLYFSIRNEKRLVRRGAIQYGKFNSLLLALAHVAYYFSALYEAYAADVEFEKTSGVGVAVMLFAYVMLFYVIYKLRDVWTVKLYIVPNQRIDRSFLFRTVRLRTTFSTLFPNSWAWLCFAMPGSRCVVACRSTCVCLPFAYVRKSAP